MNAESFVTYVATSTLDLFNTADYNPDRLTLGVSVWDLIIIIIYIYILTDATALIASKVIMVSVMLNPIRSASISARNAGQKKRNHPTTNKDSCQPNLYVHVTLMWQRV